MMAQEIALGVIFIRFPLSNRTMVGNRSLAELPSFRHRVDLCCPPKRRVLLTFSWRLVIRNGSLTIADSDCTTAFASICH